jgi:hypothetical protein
MMSEIDVAFNKVKPYLKSIGFNDDNIRGYGRVPVQNGTKVSWADFVCYHFSKFNQRKAFCVVEVKECSDKDVELSIPQAESYSQRLDAPFFCCTNGDKHMWFMTGRSQGDYIRLENAPTLPTKELLKKPAKVFIPSVLLESIRHFETKIKEKKGIYEDSKWHHDATENLHRVIADQKLRQDKLLVLTTLQNETMKSMGKSTVLQHINSNYYVFLKLLDHLRDTNVPIDIRINNCIGKHATYGIPQAGLFFVTQLLAGLFPLEYTVIHPDAAIAVQKFELSDIHLQANTVNEYLYFNEICVELNNHFENPFHFNLSYVHNFLWHYEKEYSRNGYWK